MSVIKTTLMDDNYPWDDNRILMATLTKACRVINDWLRARLPIQKGFLELIIMKL